MQNRRGQKSKHNSLLLASFPGQTIFLIFKFLFCVWKTSLVLNKTSLLLPTFHLMEVPTASKDMSLVTEHYPQYAIQGTNCKIGVCLMY